VQAVIEIPHASGPAEFTTCSQVKGGMRLGPSGEDSGLKRGARARCDQACHAATTNKIQQCAPRESCERPVGRTRICDPQWCLAKHRRLVQASRASAEDPVDRLARMPHDRVGMHVLLHSIIAYYCIQKFQGKARFLRFLLAVAL